MAAVRAAHLVFFGEELREVGAGREQGRGFRDRGRAGVFAHRLRGIRHDDLRQFGGSALTADIPVPKDGVGPGIPVAATPSAEPSTDAEARA